MNIVSKDYIIINGERNSKDYKLYVDTPLPPPCAKRRYDRLEIAGRNDIVSGTEVYDDVSYTVKGYIFSGGKNFNNNKIYELFKNAKTLEISRYNGYYFKINEIENIIPESSYDGMKIFYNINFILAPFKYKKEPSVIDVATVYTKVENAGTVYAEPIIKIKLKKSEKTILKGDVNMDGKVDSRDAQMVLAEAMRLSSGETGTFTDEQKEAADMDNDGMITTKDAAEILKIATAESSRPTNGVSERVIINTNGAELIVGIPDVVISNGFTVTIDCALQLIFYNDLNGNMVNILHYSSFDLPLLHEGDNYMKYTGDNVESVTVTLNERWL